MKMEQEDHGGGIYEYLRYSSRVFRESRAKTWESQRDYAKLLVGLASSTIVLSLTLIKVINIGDSLHGGSEVLLFVVWWCQILTIALCVGSLALSARLDLSDRIPEEVHEAWLDKISKILIGKSESGTIEEMEGLLSDPEAHLSGHYPQLFEEADNQRVDMESRFKRHERWMMSGILMAAIAYLLSLALFVVWATTL